MLKKTLSLLLALLLCLGIALPAAALEYEDPDRVRGIRLSNNSVRMTSGQTMQLTVTFTPYGTSDGLTWSSSNSAVAWVDGDGYIEAGDAGTANIEVKTDGGIRATCRVQVVSDGSRSYVSRVELSMSDLTVRAGQTRQLLAYVRPSDVDAEDKYISWTSKDGSIAEVDPDGTVRGINVGTTTIVASSDNGITASCTVTVIDSSSSAAASSASTSSAATRTASTASSSTAKSVSGTLTTASIRSAVETAARATGSGGTGMAAFVDSGILTPALIKTAASAAGNKSVVLRFATTDSDGKRSCYLTIDPKSAKDITNEIDTKVSLDSKEASSAQSTFDRYYKNTTAVIHCSQSGGFGTTATIQAKADLSGMNTDNLKFYSYDRATGKVQALDVTSYNVDRNGFLRFSTKVGGIIIVSDGALVKG